MTFFRNFKKVRRHFMILGLILGIVIFPIIVHKLTPHYSTDKNDLSADDIVLFGDQNQYVFINQRGWVLQNYVAEVYGISLDETKDSHTIQAGEFLKIDLYDLRTTDLKKKTIDFYQMNFRGKYDGYFVENPSDIGDHYYYKETDYVVLSLSKQGGNGKPDKEVLFNLDTEQIEEVTQDFLDFKSHQISLKNELSEVRHAVYFSDALEEKVGLNSYHNILTTSNQEKLKKIESTNFETLHPQIASKLTSSSEEVAIYARSGMIDQETWFNTVLHWFAPKGEESLELHAARYDFSTKPPTEFYKTPVSSYADVKAWLEAHPEEE